MKPRQMHQRLVQPNLGAAVVEELPDVELYDEDEPNQPREKTERNAARARSGPGDNPQHRMPQARRLDLKQFQTMQRLALIFREHAWMDSAGLYRLQQCRAVNAGGHESERYKSGKHEQRRPEKVGVQNVNRLRRRQVGELRIDVRQKHHDRSENQQRNRAKGVEQGQAEARQPPPPDQRPDEAELVEAAPVTGDSLPRLRHRRVKHGRDEEHKAEPAYARADQELFVTFVERIVPPIIPAEQHEHTGGQRQHPGVECALDAESNIQPERLAECFRNCPQIASKAARR